MRVKSRGTGSTAAVLAGRAIGMDGGAGAGVNAYAPALHDRCWMWGHDSGVYDGAGNAYNIPVSDPVSMPEAIAYMGVPNVCVVRWAPATADTAYLSAFRGVKRFSWVACGDERKTTRQALVDGACTAMADYPNLTGIDFDDFFNVRGGAFTRGEIDAIRARLSVIGGRRREIKLVLYSHQVRPDIKPILDRVDTVLFWTWSGSDLAVLRRNFTAYREIAPEQPTFLGIYMWDFGGAKPIDMSYMRHQLDVAIELFTSGEIDGLVFHCTPLVNKNLEAVEYARKWLKDHGEVTQANGR